VVQPKKQRTLGWRCGYAVLAIQPLFAVPIYFSVLAGSPPLWLSLVVALFPLGLRFCLTHRFIQRTPFDVPIILFALGMLIGLVVSPNKEVALGALASTLASMFIYYGITDNSEAQTNYWLYMGGAICIIALAMSVWFFSQGNGRQFFFNKWAFALFDGLPKTGFVALSPHSLGAFLAVIIPPLFSLTIFNKRIPLRIAALVLGGTFLGILFLSDSGTGWIAVVCGLVFIILCWRLWTAIIIVPTAGILTPLAVGLYSKVKWLAQSLSVESLLDRVNIWGKTINLLKGYHAIAGLGFGNWFDVYKSHYGTKVIHVHNNYLQLYTDIGIPGALAFIAALVIFVRHSVDILSASRHDSWYGVGVGLIGSIIAGAIFAFFDVTTTATVVTATGYIYLSIPLLWILAALLVVSNRRLHPKIMPK